MTTGPEERLRDLGINLAAPARPVANYVPAVRAGNLVFISGQIPFDADGLIAPEHCGKLGEDVSDEFGRDAAKRCAVNVLGQLRAEIGDLARVVRCVRLVGYVNARADFKALPQIMDGASDLMTEIFGKAGRHARTTIGVAQLPLDAAIEVEAIFEVG